MYAVRYSSPLGRPLHSHPHVEPAGQTDEQGWRPWGEWAWTRECRLINSRYKHDHNCITAMYEHSAFQRLVVLWYSGTSGQRTLHIKDTIQNNLYIKDKITYPKQYFQYNLNPWNLSKDNNYLSMMSFIQWSTVCGQCYNMQCSYTSTLHDFLISA